MAYIEFKKVDKIYQMGEVEIKALIILLITIISAAVLIVKIV